MSSKSARFLLAAALVCASVSAFPGCAADAGRHEQQAAGKSAKSEAADKSAQSEAADKSAQSEAAGSTEKDSAEEEQQAVEPLTWERIDGKWCGADGECATFLDGMTKYVFRDYPPISVRQLDKQGDCFNVLVYNEGGGGAGGYLACGVGVKPPADFGNFADGDLSRERLYPIPQNAVTEPVQPMYRQE